MVKGSIAVFGYGKNLIEKVELKNYYNFLLHLEYQLAVEILVKNFGLITILVTEFTFTFGFSP